MSRQITIQPEWSPVWSPDVYREIFERAATVRAGGQLSPVELGSEVAQ